MCNTVSFILVAHMQHLLARVLSLLFAALLSTAALPALAKDFPKGPVKIIGILTKVNMNIPLSYLKFYFK